MIVMKFGGTSVGVPEHFAVALRLVREAAPRDPVVVVSALSGVTNLIVEFCRQPERRAELSARLVERHAEWARATGVRPDAAADLLDAWQEEARALRGDRDPLDPADRDRLLSYGERLSAALFAAALREAGVDAAAVLAGDAGLVTDERFGAAHPLPDAARLLSESLTRRPPLPVVTGFLGRTADGRVTTLGRGGSDYSAALIGAALGAEEIQIWTDTSGLLSADPRIVPEARPVPLLTFAEASELAYFGARVLHPKTLLPAMERAIPVRVLNTARPDDPGSLVTPAAGPADSAWRVKSIACKKDITAVTIASTRMLLAYGFLARVFEVFGRHHVVVDLVTTSEVSISVTVDDAARLEDAVAELETIGNVEVKRGLAVVAVVGEGAPRRVGLAGHVFTLLGGVGIPVEMISQGASRVNLSFVVADEDADRSVRLLHRGLGLDLEASAPRAATSIASS
jgi:aspartate kinase